MDDELTGDEETLDDPGFVGGGGPASILDDDEETAEQLDRAGDNLQRADD